MKGYVQIDISNDFKSKLFELVDKICKFSNKDKNDIIIYSHMTLWNMQHHYTVNIPEELDLYFDVEVYDKERFFVYKTKEANNVEALYELIRAGNPIYLGEELAKVYNNLIKEFKLCSKEN